MNREVDRTWMVGFFFSALILGAFLPGCAAGLGEPCSTDGQCPGGSVCRNNIYLEKLCSDGVVPVEGEGPDGYCTLVCTVDDDCVTLEGSDGCQLDPRSERRLCLPDCP